MYSIPEEAIIRIPGKNEGATPSSYNHEVAIYEVMFKMGLCLPLPSMIRELLKELNLARSQIKPNRWVLLVSFCILWPMALGLGDHPSIKELLAFYRLAMFGHGWSFQGHPQFIILHDKWHSGNNFKRGFFVISSKHWELNGNEIYCNNPPSIFVTWGALSKSRLGAPPTLSYLEKFVVEKVRNWAKLHPNKLHSDQLVTKENLELYLGYPQGKWPSVPRDLPTAQALGCKNLQTKLSPQAKKRKMGDGGDESSPYVLCTFGEILAQGKGLNFDTPRPRAQLKVALPSEAKKEASSLGGV